MTDKDSIFLGTAIVFCEGSLATTYGKTAHGLIRHTDRFRILSVVDSEHAGRDAGKVIGGRSRSIPVYADIQEAVDKALEAGEPAEYMVIGLALEGRELPQKAREAVETALLSGLNICSGLHYFLSEDKELSRLASEKGAVLLDVRKPPLREQLHFFSGKIAEVKSFKIAVLGTDSAVGKRTTAVILIEALRQAGHTAELVGTGQTSWMQGIPYTLILDTLINDFVAGEIEHAVWQAWKDKSSDVIMIEGQGSLLNPAFPGGFEILAAARPDIVILQHAPARKEYDGFPEFPIHPLEKQIAAVELISGKPVAAVTINSEGLDANGIEEACRAITGDTGLPAADVIHHGPEVILKVIERKRIETGA